MDRWILHVDMDEFFAAVEKLDNPQLVGKCLLVAGQAERRGVVSTASYEARRFGCHSAMPTSKAMRLCPQAIVLPIRGERYAEVSRAVFEIFSRFTPLVEPLSIDEAFLDLTGSERLFGPAENVARAIKQAIRDELGLVASVGVAPNKFLAKIASDLQKPDGLTIITPQNIHATLDALPIGKLWGVGPAAAKQFQRYNIKTIGQLRAMPRKQACEWFGRMGEHFWALANGIDERPVTPDSRAKSIGQETTFPTDVCDMDHLLAVLDEQIDHVARRLRRHGFLARTVTLKLRYSDFTTISRSLTLPQPSNVTAEFRNAARGLLEKWATRSFRALRLLGVTLSQFQTHTSRQLSLFENPQNEKLQRLDKTLDNIKNKFGQNALKRGTTMKPPEDEI